MTQQWPIATMYILGKQAYFPKILHQYATKIKAMRGPVPNDSWGLSPKIAGEYIVYLGNVRFAAREFMFAARKIYRESQNVHRIWRVLGTLVHIFKDCSKK